MVELENPKICFYNSYWGSKYVQLFISTTNWNAKCNIVKQISDKILVTRPSIDYVSCHISSLGFLIVSLCTSVEMLIEQHYFFHRLNTHKRKEENKKTEMKVKIWNGWLDKCDNSVAYVVVHIK